MSVLCLLTAAENYANDTFIVSVVLDPHAQISKAFVIELIRLINSQLSIGTGSLKVQEYKIFYKKIGVPSLTCFIFTSNDYSSKTANECLDIYFNHALREYKDLPIQSTTTNLFLSSAGAERLLTMYRQNFRALTSQTDPAKHTKKDDQGDSAKQAKHDGQGDRGFFRRLSINKSLPSLKGTSVQQENQPITTKPRPRDKDQKKIKCIIM